MVNGVQQSPMEGTSMLYSFNEADAAERHDLQYFEMFANRGIYHQGWSAVTKHRTPWVMVGGASPRSTTTCGSCTTATPTSARPATSPPSTPTSWQLQRLWLIEATKYNVLPMDDRTRTARADHGGSADPDPGQLADVLPRHGRLSENSVVSIKNKSFSITAEVDVPRAGRTA